MSRSHKYQPPPEDFEIPLPDNLSTAKDPQLNEEEILIARTLPNNYLSFLIAAMKTMEDKEVDILGAFWLLKIGVIPGNALVS